MRRTFTRRHFGALSATLVASSILPAAKVGAQDATPVAFGATPTADGRLVVHPRGETVVPLEPQSVIAMGDEWLLADLLDFEVNVIASSAAYGDAFIGLEPADTEGIQPFPLFEADIEQLLMLQPDLLIVGDYVFDYVEGLYETLSGFAPVVSVPDREIWQDDYRFEASVFGKEELANQLIAEYEELAAETAAAVNLAGTTVSVTTVYQGEPEVAAWVTTNLAEVDVLAALGATIVPSAEDYDVDGAGRVRFSMEEIAVLDGEWMIMLQTSSQPEEQETLNQVISNPLWQSLPSVQAEQVEVLERAGQPGYIRGRKKLLGIYSEIFQAS